MKHFNSKILATSLLLCAGMLTGCLTDDKGDEDSGPTISVGPADQVANEGSIATFTVTASGTGNLDYQWTLNGDDLEGKTSSTLTLTARDSLDNAEIRVRVSDDKGSTTSDIAYLRIGVETETFILGAQGSSTASSVDLDTDPPTTYTATAGASQSNAIDVVFAYSTSTGNDSLALYSPSVAKNGTGGAGTGFAFMNDWPSANNTQIRRVDVANWNNVRTASDIENLFTNGSAGETAGRIFVREGTTVVVKSNQDKYVLLEVTIVTAQSASGAGTIRAKAKW